MNDIQIFSVRSLEQTQREINAITLKPYQGFVYALEYGRQVKIGFSKNPAVRLAQLKHQAEQYGDLTTGRLVLSKPCTNFTEIEKELHTKFSSFRKERTELFDIPFENVVESMGTVNYRNDTEQKQTEERANAEKLQGALANAMAISQFEDLELVSTTEHYDGCKVKVGLDADWGCVTLALNHFEDDTKWSGQPLSAQVARHIAEQLLKYASVADVFEAMYSKSCMANKE